MSLSLKFTVASFTICSTTERFSRFVRTTKATSMSSASNKSKSTVLNNFLTLLRKVAYLESPLRITPTVNLPALMLFCRLQSKKRRAFSAKYPLLIWQETKEELTVTSKANRLKQMEQKSANRCWLSSNAFEHSIKAKVTLHSEGVNSLWFSRILSLEIAKL